MLWNLMAMIFWAGWQSVSLLCSPRAAYICLLVRRIVSISHDVRGQVEARLTPMIGGTLDLLYRSNGVQRIDTKKLCILPFCRESVMKALHERQAHMHEPLATVLRSRIQVTKQLLECYIPLACERTCRSPVP